MSVLFLQITITHKWVLLCKLHALDRCLCVCFYREWVWGSIGRRMLRTCAIVTFQALHKTKYLILCKLPATLVVFTNVRKVNFPRAK